MTINLQKWIRLFLVLAIVLLLDQVSKRWIMASQPYEITTQPIPALAPFFQFTYTQNTGAAFGLLPQASDLFLIIAVVVTIGMIIFYPRIPPKEVVTQVALALVLAGALGNALDRLQFGAVIDFIHYQIPGIISNVSNLADHAIVGGVLILFIQSWHTGAGEDRQADTAKAGDETTPGSV